MNNTTREEILENWLSLGEDDLPRLIDCIYFRRDKVRLGSVIKRLSEYEKVKAMHSYFVEEDIDSCKQNFYLASKLDLASVGLDGGEDFSLGGAVLTALLSDNIEVINEVAHIETPVLVRERNKPRASRPYVYMLQLAIRGEDELLQSIIDGLAKNGNKRDRAECAAGRDFFSLLLKRDKDGLEDLIQNKDARIKSADPVQEHFMSFLGALEAKLCWFKGIPVKIDSPLVPMELMAIRPIAHYDDVYDFIKPGWVPPSQGLIGKMSRWLHNKS